MTSANDYEQLELQQQYSRINVRWDASDDELDNDNSSARLFERSRIKALAGRGRVSGLLGPPRVVPATGVPPCPLSLQTSGRPCRRKPSPSG